MHVLTKFKVLRALNPSEVSVPSDRCYLFRWRQAADERLEVDFARSSVFHHFITASRLKYRSISIQSFNVFTHPFLNHTVLVSIYLYTPIYSYHYFNHSVSRCQQPQEIWRNPARRWCNQSRWSHPNRRGEVVVWWKTMAGAVGSDRTDALVAWADLTIHNNRGSWMCLFWTMLFLT